MGRLTLNVLLSFAQFERDMIAASKRRGIWVGGPVPLGYASIGKKLVVVPEDAETVRAIFARYVALGSIGPLAEDLDRSGIRTKQRRVRFGVAWPLATVVAKRTQRFNARTTTSRSQGHHHSRRCRNTAPAS